MKSIHAHRKEIKKAAASLEHFNDLACIHFAAVLRDHDKYLRICGELGIKPERLIPVEYFEVVYKILSFGPLEWRATFMLGPADDIERVVSKVQTAKGFMSENNYWIDL